MLTLYTQLSVENKNELSNHASPFKELNKSLRLYDYLYRHLKIVRLGVLKRSSLLSISYLITNSFKMLAVIDTKQYLQVQKQKPFQKLARKPVYILRSICGHNHPSVFMLSSTDY